MSTETIFSPGDKVTPVPAAYTLTRGAGPFEIVDVMNVPGHDLTSVGHPQWVTIRRPPDGDVVMGYDGKPQRFSGSYFVKIEET